MTGIGRFGIIGMIAIAPWLMGATKEGDNQPAKSAAQAGVVKGKASDGKAGAPAASATTAQKPVYRPPLRGAPAGRIGGGTRGASERESFSLQVLAPDHVGYATSKQPTLYWFISKSTTYAIEITVSERNAVKPLVEKRIAGPEKGGIQRVRLADLGVALRPNVPYKWFVTLVTDADQRSKDILAGGIIQCKEQSSSLAERLKGADKGVVPLIYAEEGYWYDALDSLSALIDGTPAGIESRRLRAALLEQVGLTEAAQFEKAQIPGN